MSDRHELLYVHDPMCSWCWGFRPTLQRLRSLLPPQVHLRYLLGGLAPDTDQPMPADLQRHLQDTWRRIQQRIPGTEFNFAFWRQCEPRRSTYPACRAVLAAEALAPGGAGRMLEAIQRAYYLRAMNPSDSATLEQLAQEIGLDRQSFVQLLHSERIEAQLQEEIRTAHALGVRSFPALVLHTGGGSYWPVPVEYTDAPAMLATIETLIA